MNESARVDQPDLEDARRHVVGVGAMDLVGIEAVEGRSEETLGSGDDWWTWYLLVDRTHAGHCLAGTILPVPSHSLSCADQY